METELKNSCNLYILLWCIYALHGFLYESGATWSIVILISLIVWSIYHFFKVNKKRHSPDFFGGATLLLAMIVLYGIILYITDGSYTTTLKGDKVASYYYLEKHLISILPIYSFYYFAQKGLLDEKHLRIWFFIFIAVGIGEYIRESNEMIARYTYNVKDADEITNNGGYIIAYLIPGTFLFRKKPALQFTLLVLCEFFVFYSIKRGAIIISLLPIIMFLWFSLKEKKGSNKISIMIIAVIGFYVLAYYIGNYISHNDYFQYRIQETLEGNSSRRDILYESFIDVFTNKSSLFNQLFGHGANGSLKVSFNYAHNDWLEILTNQGVLGVLVFLYYWKSFFKTSKSRLLTYDSRYIILCFFCFFLLQTLFSMNINEMTFYTSSVLGLALANGFEKK